MKHNCRIHGLLIPAATLILWFSSAVHGQAVTGSERPPSWLSPTAVVATRDGKRSTSHAPRRAGSWRLTFFPGVFVKRL